MYWILGAVIATWRWGKRLGFHAPFLGMMIVLLPDGIPLVASFFDFRWQVLVERGPGHSLGFAALCVGISTRWLAPELKKRFKLKPREFAIGMGMILAARLLLDVLSTEGAALLWPLLRSRYALRLIQQPDYILLTLLSACGILLIARQTRKKPSARLRKWALSMVVCLLGHLLFAASMQWRVRQHVDRNLARNHLKPEAVMVAATTSNPLFWRVVVRQTDGFLLAYRSIFDAARSEFHWVFIPQERVALERLEPAWEVRAAKDLAGIWWVARAHGKGAWLGDLSRGERRDWSVRQHMVHLQCRRAWFYDRESSSSRLLPVTPRGAPRAEVLRRATQRIRGHHQAWDAFPRLAGVPGQLSEDLVEIIEIAERD